ncbi:MAG: hypothetical protein U9N36_08225 [Euryarchaeota archaeon]|nr:hypothetical protein [Euryarchaeota archaeon]
MPTGSEGKVVKADTLKDMYRVFAYEPLIRDDFGYYVKRESPRENFRLGLLCGGKRYLLAGHSGCGKSTELIRLSDELKDDFFVVYFSVEGELDIDDLQCEDVLVAIGLKIFKEAKRLEEDGSIEKLNTDIIDDFYEFLSDVTEIKVEERIKEKGIGAKLTYLLSFSGWLKSESRTRVEMRRKLEHRLSDLIERIDNMVSEAEIKTKKPVLVIVDDLEKIPRIDAAKKLFYEDIGVLLQIKPRMIYTIPISLVLDPIFAQIKSRFDDDQTLPNIKIKDRDGNLLTGGKEFFENFVNNRIGNKQLIEREALDFAIGMSGGVLGQFVNIVRNSSIYALQDGDGCIKKRHIELYVHKERRSFDRFLSYDDIEFLKVIHDNKDARDGDTLLMLLHSLSILEYQNDNNWFDVNPIIIPLLEK